MAEEVFNTNLSLTDFATFHDYQLYTHEVAQVLYPELFTDENIGLELFIALNETDGWDAADNP